MVGLLVWSLAGAGDSVASIPPLRAPGTLPCFASWRDESAPLSVHPRSSAVLSCRFSVPGLRVSVCEFSVVSGQLSVTRYYIWGPNGLLCQIGADGTTTQYYHADEQGSTLALTDATGTVTDQFAYTPYGECTARTGTTATPYQWLGGVAVRTEGNGLCYMLNRYYSLSQKRFISADPSGIDGGPNLYAYANLNPLFFTDPFGLCAESFSTSVNRWANNGWDSREQMLWQDYGIQNYAGSVNYAGGSSFGALDAVQVGLATVGVIDPTSISDGLNAMISIARGDYAGAAISTAAMLPYIGDTAKLAAGGTRMAMRAADSFAPMAANAPVIIGENMSRVNAYAGRVGGETIDGWLAGRKWTQQLNDEFIATMKAQGRQFQDIGPDFGRRLQNGIDPNLGRPPSSVYGGERQSLLDYGNYQRLYDRTGKYQGGVPGLDP
jgi:RHS repeat-associated protein